MDAFVSLLMTPLMAVEILFGEFLVARRFEKRTYFYLRFFGSAAVMLVLTVWIELMYYLVTGTQFNYSSPSDNGTIVFKVFYYLLIFGMTIFCLWFSYRQFFILILVSASIGYATQHLAFSIGNLLTLATDPADLSGALAYFTDFAVWLVSRGSVYGFMAYILRKKRFEEAQIPGNAWGKVILCFLVIIVFICLSRLSYDDPDRSLFASIVEPCYAMICSGLIIVVQFGLASNDEANREIADIRELLHQEREQYRLTKENIEIINEKCHDLKHQISALREGESGKYLSEIENSIMIYDSTVKTGSTVLDILLTEKKLQCEAKKINLTTMVNGELLSFMEEMDVYSLFGNALSNAIESVSNIPEDDRHITLKVYQTGEMCSIHVENPYTGTIRFSDDLPETTKDRNYHGFGMRSMNRIVSSYGGIMTVTAENSVFVLDILIPSEKK